MNPKVPPFQGNISFNAQHAPMGAFFSFTCGHFGTAGGMGLQIGRPGDQDVLVGVKQGDRFSTAPLHLLPFYQGADTDEAARYQVESADPSSKSPPRLAIPAERITRRYGLGSDTWQTADFSFTLHTPFAEIPDPHESVASAVAERLWPGVVASLVVDNRGSDRPKTAIFALNFGTPGAAPRQGGFPPGAVAFVHRDGYALAGDARDENARVIPVIPLMRFSPELALLDRHNSVHMLSKCCGFAVEVPPGRCVTMRLVFGCHLPQPVTTRLVGRYLYNRYYSDITHVLRAGFESFDRRVEESYELDARLLDSTLNPDQQFIIAHACRSYFGSTQLLEVGGEPFWIVNEGEYCMMNTLDLSVDQVFFELAHNPWVVRNLLDRFTRHYSYVDRVKVPKAQATTAASHFESSDEQGSGGYAPRVLGSGRPLSDFDLRPGGIAFCHDMGIHNNFSPEGHSSYELSDINGCFSHMTAEQICNWTLIACCYVHQTADQAWVERNLHTLDACLSSLINRGGEAGFCQYDSDRCLTGSEITTYDSLDHSLAQTRANVYMATKTWAAYRGLAMLLKGPSPQRAELAGQQARRVESYVAEHVSADGVLPAVFEKDNPGYRSRILPAVEGLVYPLFWNDPTLAGESKAFVELLSRHVRTLLLDPQRRNLFADGGIRLSDTSSNSWMSKIALFMHVSDKLLGLTKEPEIAAIFTRADAAHVKWQTETQGPQGSAYWACSDQMVNGVARGSKYYPRIVTTWLWLS